MVVDLNVFFLKTLYHWTAAFECLYITRFNDFLDFFLFLVKCLSCILSVYLGCALSLFNKIRSLIKKEKEIHGSKQGDLPASFHP